jgi:thiol-disulfide isomerase/thioredoxin
MNSHRATDPQRKPKKPGFLSSVPLCLCGILLFSVSLRAADLDPAAVLRTLRTERAERTKFVKGAPSPDYKTVDADIAAKAAAALGAIDPAKADLTKARDLAALFTLAEKHPAAVTVLRRHLAQPGLSESERFATQTDLAVAAEKVNDGQTVYEMVKEMKVTPANAVNVGSYFGGQYHYYIFNARGARAVLDLLDKIEPLVPTAGFASDQARKDAGWSRRQLAATRALYLSELGKNKEAIAVIDRALASLDDDIFRKKDLLGDRQRYEALDQPAPALTVDRVHGKFAGLEAYRGKVLMVEFTAHWCHACHAALPALVQLYAELKSKGFEIVSVTTFYGHFRNLGLPDKKMPKDEEFAKMPAMLAEQHVTWPMVYTDSKTFAAYGVNGIPQLTLLDKQGRIRKIDRGFSVEKMDRMRETIVSLLAE